MPLRKKFEIAKESLAQRSSAIRNYVTDPVNELYALTPDPDELMTEEIKKSYEKMQKNIQDLHKAGIGIAVEMPKKYQGNAELYYKIGETEYVHKIEKPASGVWANLHIRSAKQKIEITMNKQILDVITPEGVLVVLDAVEPFKDKDGNKSVVFGAIRDQEGDHPLVLRLVK